MKNNFKKYGVIILALSMVFVLSTSTLATASTVTNGSIDLELSEKNKEVSETITQKEPEKQDIVEDTKTEKIESSKDEGVKLNDASETIINSKDKKAERIAELTDKYNDRIMGTVAYYLEVLQKYSVPICFIGLAMGAFNFLIIGNKKLDKREQGFAWIVGFTIGLVVFNVIPLLFALIVAGR